MDTTTRPSENLAKRVRYHRRNLDITQDELAMTMRTFGHQWTRTTSAKIENGSRNVTTDELVDLALTFAVSIDQLISPRP